MNVEEFVKETLEQVCNAAESIEDTSKGKCINPEIPVHFDLAVVTTDNQSKNGGCRIQVASILKAGGEKTKEKGVQEYNRVSFDLMLHIPTKSF